jgi:hypothetical protein
MSTIGAFFPQIIASGQPQNAPATLSDPQKSHKIFGFCDAFWRCLSVPILGANTETRSRFRESK